MLWSFLCRLMVYSRVTVSRERPPPFLSFAMAGAPRERTRLLEKAAMRAYRRPSSNSWFSEQIQGVVCNAVLEVVSSLLAAEEGHPAFRLAVLLHAGAWTEHTRQTTRQRRAYADRQLAELRNFQQPATGVRASVPYGARRCHRDGERGMLRRSHIRSTIVARWFHASNSDVGQKAAYHEQLLVGTNDLHAWGLPYLRHGEREE